MTIPLAIFGGLALIAISIYFSVGSLSVHAYGGVQKVQICDRATRSCATVKDGNLFVSD